MNNIKAVVFDFGGVFTSSPVESFAKFEKANDLPSRFIGEVIKNNHHENAWAKFERAEIDRKEFDSAFAQESSAAGFEITGETLLSLLVLSLKPAMIEALYKVKAAGYKTGCITNNLPSVGSKDMVEAGSAAEADALMAAFDHVIESSKAGIRKPEPKIYTMMTDLLNLQPEETVFLDDLGINLKGAKAVGMHTIKVPFGDVTPAIDELMALLEL